MDVTATWYENVTWKNADGSETKSCNRVLSCQRIHIDPNNYSWRPGSRQSGNGMLLANFVIPKTARDSYKGILVDVSHSVVVKASMKGWWTSSPESSGAVQVVQGVPRRPSSNQLSSTPTTPQTAEAVPVFDSTPAETMTNTNDQVLVQAQAIPADWQPETSQVVVIPDSAIVSDAISMVPSFSAEPALNPDYHEGYASAQVAPPEYAATTGLRASAPSESLLSSGVPTASESGESSVVLELKAVATTCPENISIILQDDEWSDAVRDLGDDDIADILQACNKKQKLDFASALCRVMNQSHQVAACLQALPYHQRLTMLQQVEVEEFDSNIESQLPPLEARAYRESRRKSKQEEKKPAWLQF